MTCSDFEELHPTFSEVLACDVLGVGGARVNFEAAMPSPQTARAVEWRFGYLRMKIPAAITPTHAGVQYPRTAFAPFIERVRDITAEVMERERAVTDAQTDDWLNGRRTVTEKVYPAPQGNPTAAYVDTMRTQEEQTTDAHSPERVREFLAAPLTVDECAEHYRSLFLGVVL